MLESERLKLKAAAGAGDYMSRNEYSITIHNR